jgi:hypothetical protein
MANKIPTLERLSKEKFDGKPLDFVKLKWGDVVVNHVEDRENHYFSYGDLFMVQSIAGRDRTARCYECDTPIQFKERSVSIHFSEFPGLLVGGGEVETKRIPYCPKCQEEPIGHGIKDI